MVLALLGRCRCRLTFFFFFSFSFFSLFVSFCFYSILFDFRCSLWLRRTLTSLQCITHNYESHSVHYFCRSSDFFFSSNLFTSHSSPFEIDPIVAFYNLMVIFIFRLRLSFSPVLCEHTSVGLLLF